MTPLLRELHWLRVPERIQFRLCVLTYRCLHGSAPSYLAETLRLTSDMESRRTSLELNIDIRQISVVISDIPAQSEVAAVQCIFSRRLNITACAAAAV